jgi:hypothetical protein
VPSRRLRCAVRLLRDARVVLHELKDTLEPLFAVTDTVIVKCLFVYLLLEKAWRLAH